MFGMMADNAIVMEDAEFPYNAEIELDPGD